jgi:glycerol uptake facilitator-like aquaporin
MGVFRGLPWFKAFTYILGQLVGAWLGALIVFANYSRAIDIFEGGNGQLTLKSAGLFSTYPVSSCFPPFCPYLTLVNYFGLARLHVIGQLFFR